MPTAEFPGRYDSLAEVSEFVRQAALSAGLDEAEVYAVQLAVDEAFTNIIDHAYRGEGIGSVRCTCLKVEQGLEIVLHDEGDPFMPESVPPLDPTIPLMEVRSRGAGLHLIRALMDEVIFEFDSQTGNTLTLIKHHET